MKLERSKPEDATECVRWMLANLALNDCSPRTLKGSVFYKIDGVLYLPVKPVLMLESLAPNPAVTGKKRLLAIRRAMDDLRALYPDTEIIFLTSGKTKLDEAARYYGFKEEPYRVYRMIGGSRVTVPGTAGRQSKGTATAAEQGVVDEASLRPDGGAGGAKEAGATGNVSYMRSPARERRSEEPAGSRSHSGNEDRSGHRSQSLQFGHRSRA